MQQIDPDLCQSNSNELNQSYVTIFNAGGGGGGIIYIKIQKIEFRNYTHYDYVQIAGQMIG